MVEQPKGVEVTSPSLPFSNVTPSRQILALEVRPQRIGFIVLQGVTRLLDWGVRTYGKQKDDAPSAGCAKVAVLLELYSPAVIVIRRRSASTAPRKTISATVAKIAAEARRRSIPCRFVVATEVRRFFARYDGTTKHAIASLVAGWFPDLAWKLPPKRRPWESERYNTAIFDAAATAVAYLGKINRQRGPFDGPSARRIDPM